MLAKSDIIHTVNVALRCDIKRGSKLWQLRFVTSGKAQ